MIIFHEGLPRHGKSYEAVVNQIIPTLLKGRHVFTNIAGINYEKFAEVTGLPLERIQELLHVLTDEQIPDVQNHVADDSLVLIDELQNFFPAGKSTLDQGMTQFVTMHGHRGIDIVCMGQDHRDCHMLWKRRIDTLITFVKRDVVGRPNEYTWTTYRQRNKRFEKLRSGVGTYDQKYFGLYKSHNDGVKSIDDHKDERINVLKSKIFTFWLPVLGIVLCLAVYYLWGFFHNAGAYKQPETPTAIVPATPEEASPLPPGYVPPAPPPASLPPVPVQTEPVKTAVFEDEYLEKYLTDYRPRLVGLIESKNKLVARVEFLDASNRVFERMNIPQLVAFGYEVQRKPYGLLLIRGDKRYPVTAFPVEVAEGVTRPLPESAGQEEVRLKRESAHSNSVQMSGSESYIARY